MMVSDTVRCPSCHDSFSGPWCDNCDQWPCRCVHVIDKLELRGTLADGTPVFRVLESHWEPR